MADPEIGKTYALKFVDVDGNTQSTADGRITVLVLMNKAGFSKARMVGERVPDRCLANPAYRMITVVKFAKHSAPVQKFFTVMARGRLDKEAAILQKRYVAQKIKKDARRDVFAVTDFGGVIASQLQSEQSVFRVFVVGRKGELLQRWDDVPITEQLAEALK
jgi:hypothetical protein